MIFSPVKKQVQFCPLYALKFKSCSKFLKTHIQHLEQVRVKYTKLCTCILFSLKKNYVINMSYYEVSVKNDEKWHISPQFFEQENVSPVVDHNEIYISYVKSHNKDMVLISLWSMAGDTFFLFEKLLKICVFCLVSRKIRENALFMTSQLAL